MLTGDPLLGIDDFCGYSWQLIHPLAFKGLIDNGKVSLFDG
jgi:hypothetical protein